jgi:hypothetical protein
MRRENAGRLFIHVERGVQIAEVLLYCERARRRHDLEDRMVVTLMKPDQDRVVRAFNVVILSQL